jgi:hypothetical protein
MLAKHSIACIVWVGVVALTIGPNVSAQENQSPPSSPLQWPTDVSANPAEFFFISTLRANIELAGNTSLCKVLMRHAKPPIPVPDPFTYANNCPRGIQSKIQSRQGLVHWKDGAQPTGCGSSCMDAPLVLQTLNLGTPNVRYASVSGKLGFDADLPAPLGTRGLIFYLHVDFKCDIPAGMRTGELNMTSTVDPPYIEGPGVDESIIAALLDVSGVYIFTGHLSDLVTQGIKDSLGPQASSTTSTGADLKGCSSIGVTNEDIPSFLWDVPKRSITAVGANAVKTRADLHFDHITNLMPPDDPHTTMIPRPIPNLTLYVNGVPAHIPFPNKNARSYDPKVCVTFPMDGADRLQVLLNDGAGGAIWSEFSPTENFGSGSHSLVTVRNVVVMNGPHGRPQKGTSPGVQLDYRIVFHSGQTSEGTTASTGPTRGPGAVRGPAATTSVGEGGSEPTCSVSTR